MNYWVAKIFIFIPIVVIKIYKKTLPTLEAPTPSKFLTFVKERKRAIVVDITIIQKKLDVRLNLDKPGALFLINGVI